jgi:hypothetical protein
MIDKEALTDAPENFERAQGEDDSGSAIGVASLSAGLAFALLLSGMSFLVAQTSLLRRPGLTVGLAVLALAQWAFTSCFSCTSAPGPTTRTTS